MSVQTEIGRLSGAKSAIAAAIADKGVTVPDGTKIDGMAALIARIEVGGGSVQPDWNQNDPAAADYVKNRPFYEDCITITWDGDTTGLDPQAPFCLVKEGNYTKEQLVGSKVIATGSEGEISEEVIITQEDILEDVPGSVYCAEVVAYFPSYNYEASVFVYLITVETEGFSPGIYFMLGNSGSYVSELKLGAVSTISPKFLPESTDSKPGVVKLSSITTPYVLPYKAPADEFETAIGKLLEGKAVVWWVDNDDGIPSMRQIVHAFLEGDGVYFVTVPNCPNARKITRREDAFGDLFYYFDDLNNDPDYESIDVIKTYEIETEWCIIHSSTPSSTKKFRITVDDTGTISATEVT